MKRLFVKSSVILACVGALSCLVPAHAQSKSVTQKTLSTQTARTSNMAPANLEGVTLKNGASSIVVLSNVSIEKTGSTQAAPNAVKPLAPSFLKKIGAYEIHQATITESARRQAQGQSLPAFAQTNAGSDFVGVAYLNDTRELGLISREVVAKFKAGGVPAPYASRDGKELVPGSGLYVFHVVDVYDWIRLVSRLQADAQVSLVEPQIKTNFAAPN